MLIEVLADVVCPWSYIGWHRLARALATRPHRHVLIRWRPFRLDPTPAQRVDPVRVAVEEAAAHDGLPLIAERITITANSTDAHRLIEAADRFGHGNAMIEILFRAHFVEGRDIAERDVLIELAARAGLARTVAAEVLDGDDGHAMLQTTEAMARRLGLHAVPSFVFNHRFAISGAHDPACLLPLLDLPVGEPPQTVVPARPQRLLYEKPVYPDDMTCPLPS
jgi:predicted DsbA family dithiol-disulfide isomerase